ncbi:MAG: NAD(P)H-quinone oxidoreductase [Acidimicrobiia bacterium]|nr:NAD(P)H-quinone oxidoreductase [Acidimicrobiia bacterium]
MRAVVIDEPGGPDVLRVADDVPDPEPGPEEVVVEVAATALNRADLLQRRGLYPGPPMDPEIPGMELAGTVVTCGVRASALAVGDRVMGIVGGGAYAERIAVHERQLMVVPEGLTFVEAAAIPEVFITAWDAMVVQGGLTSGRVALVHAGASGVGTAAIGLARALGASVVVTASAAKVDRCRALGADVAVDYASEDFVVACRQYTSGRGVDVVVDLVGGDYVDRNIDALAVGGRIVQVGVMGGGRTEVTIGKLLPKRASIIGTVLRSRPIEEKIAVTQRFAREILPLFDRGVLAPVVDSTFPLERIGEAHEYMEANRNVGKIVVTLAGR